MVLISGEYQGIYSIDGYGTRHKSFHTSEDYNREALTRQYGVWNFNVNTYQFYYGVVGNGTRRYGYNGRFDGGIRICPEGTTNNSNSLFIVKSTSNIVGRSD